MTTQLHGLVQAIQYQVDFKVLNDTFNNILAMSWQSVLLVEETGVPGENHKSLTNVII
jgi:hypothetical protein